MINGVRARTLARDAHWPSCPDFFGGSGGKSPGSLVEAVARAEPSYRGDLSTLDANAQRKIARAIVEYLDYVPRPTSRAPVSNRPEITFDTSDKARLRRKETREHVISALDVLKSELCAKHLRGALLSDAECDALLTDLQGLSFVEDDDNAEFSLFLTQNKLSFGTGLLARAGEHSGGDLHVRPRHRGEAHARRCREQQRRAGAVDVPTDGPE